MINKNLITYGIISSLIIFFFGFNFLLSLLGNILILLFLIPILLIFIFFLGINTFKSKFKICTNCGKAILSQGESCIYCGSSFSVIENIKTYSEEASSETIEIEAEEIN